MFGSFWELGKCLESYSPKLQNAAIVKESLNAVISFHQNLNFSGNQETHIPQFQRRSTFQLQGNK